jgi:hypothetical protein
VEGFLSLRSDFFLKAAFLPLPCADYVKKWKIVWSVEQYEKDLLEMEELKKIP